MGMTADELRGRMSERELQERMILIGVDDDQFGERRADLRTGQIIEALHRLSPDGAHKKTFADHALSFKRPESAQHAHQQFAAWMRWTRSLGGTVE